jgi:hypothetical protein
MDYGKELSKVRAAIEKLQQEREDIGAMLLPKAEAKENIAAVVRSRAASDGALALAVRGFADPNPKEHHESWQRLMKLRTSLVNGREEPTPTVDAGDLLAWLMQEELIRLLQAKIDADDYVPGLPLADRRARLAAIEKELYPLEVKEEALIVQAEAEGIYLTRRPNANVLVIMEYDPDGDLIEPGLPRARVRPGSSNDGAEGLGQAMFNPGATGQGQQGAHGASNGAGAQMGLLPMHPAQTAAAWRNTRR